jgi:hypothetical protein
MPREVQQRFQERVMLQIRREFPEVEAAMKMDKANRLNVKLGKTPRHEVEKIIDFGK